MAVKDEQTTTRARANILREYLTNSLKINPFDHKEIYQVMDLCLSCKACKAECPSNVDIAKLKAEFLQHYYDANGVPLRSLLIAHITRLNRLGMISPSAYNFFMKNGVLSALAKKFLGFAPKRTLPLLSPVSFRGWAGQQSPQANYSRSVYLFVDEFTNYNDAEIGKKAFQLLNRLGYKVLLPDHTESGRTYLSKGLLRTAKKLANENIRKLKDLITPETPLIGLEPSAILTFRDEYPDLADEELKADAKNLAGNTFLFEEFFQQIATDETRKLFTNQPAAIRLHGHCHQKALASIVPTIRMLTTPVNYRVEEIRSGCCGMAGAFGYEKEHYEVSMQVGELVLFPEVRKSPADVIIAAPGTSCRHQIFDGTGRKAWHPVEVLWGALAENRESEVGSH